MWSRNSFPHGSWRQRKAKLGGPRRLGRTRQQGSPHEEDHISLAAGALTLSIAACNTPGERAVGGAAIGGLAGAAIGGAATGRGSGALAGAAIGAAGGAVVGAATAPATAAPTGPIATCTATCIAADPA